MSAELITSLVNQKITGTEIFPVEIKITPGKIIVLLDKPTGVTINECADVSRFLYNNLDASGLLDTHELEVGSPGMDQPLKVLQQYQKRIGRQVKVVTKTGRVHTGRLDDANQNGFSIYETATVREGKTKVRKEETVNFLFTDVKETKLEINFNKQ